MQQDHTSGPGSSIETVVSPAAAPDGFSGVAAALIDERELLKRWGNNRPLCATLIRKFEVQARDDMPKFERAAAGGDMEQLGFLAHSLKGAAAYVAALEVNRIAGELEAAAKASEADVAIDLSKQLCAALVAGLPQLAAAADRVAAAEPG